MSLYELNAQDIVGVLTVTLKFIDFLGFSSFFLDFFLPIK
jgi:hypothetical protein